MKCNNAWLPKLCAPFTRLHIPQTVIEPLTGNQIFVGPFSHNTTQIHHHNLVGVTDGREPVGNNDRRTILRNHFEGTLNGSSVSLSTAEVASSSTKIGGSFRMARAIEMR